MALKTYINKLLNYTLKLKRTDSNLDTPNKMATTCNLNWSELEKYINNLRALLIEIAETVDVEGLVAKVLDALLTRKYHLRIEHKTELGLFALETKQHGRTIQVQEIVNTDGPNEFIITGFENTTQLMVQTRVVYVNDDGTEYEMLGNVPVKLEHNRITIQPFTKLDRDLHIIIM